MNPEILRTTESTMLLPYPYTSKTNYQKTSFTAWEKGRDRWARSPWTEVVARSCYHFDKHSK